MANVSIGGDVKDSVLVFGNDNFVVNIGDVNGGVVNIVKPSDKPKYSARPAPVVIKPRAFPSLLGRSAEAENIRAAVEKSAPVSVWGQEGIGKTSLLRYLTHTLGSGNFPNGLVFFDASGLGHEDLLQSLFDLFFESDVSYKPTRAEILKVLQNLKALIFIDNIEIGRSETIAVLDAMPNSIFVLSSKDQSIWGEGESMPLRGLPEDECLKLFEKELSRPLNEAERPVAARISSALQGSPLKILQTASLARSSGKSLEAVEAEVSRGEAGKNGMVNLANLDDNDKQILALLAAAGGTIVSLEHIRSIIKAGNPQAQVEGLVASGLVQAHSPRYSITTTFAASLSAAWDLASWQDALLDHSIYWLGQKPPLDIVRESLNLFLHVLRGASARKKYAQVIQLGRRLERFTLLFKRWQAWAEILNLILEAARALKDSKTAAWALHQLGSRAGVLGQSNEAREFLTQALQIRRQIGDKAGELLTQHNLNTLMGIITPPAKSGSGCRKYLPALGCAAALLFSIFVLILVLIFYPRPNTPAETATFAPTRTAARTATATIPAGTPTGTSTLPPPTKKPVFTPTAPSDTTTDPIIVSETINFGKAGGIPNTQRSAPLDFSVEFDTRGLLYVKIVTGEGACSDVFVHILVDGVERYTTGNMGPISGMTNTGSIDIGPVSSGSHTLTLSPEGVPNNDDGSCNTGSLLSWSGKVTITTNK